MSDLWQNVPPELRARRQWCVWRYEKGQGDRDTKVPYRPRATVKQKASSTDPSTWSDFGDAVAVAQLTPLKYDGIGYMMSEEDPFVGIDLDDCIDPTSGVISTGAVDILKRLPSYTEISPSGVSLRIFVRAAWPGKDHRKGRRKGDLEVYAGKRFLTITGNVLEGSPREIVDHNEAFALWLEEMFPEPASPPPASAPSRSAAMSDDDVIARAMSASNGNKFRALWQGDDAAYDSASEADLALVSLLAFYTQDEGQLERLVARSGLSRAKWTDRSDYRHSTITKALEGLGETYSPPTPKLRAAKNGHSGAGGKHPHREDPETEQEYSRDNPAPDSKEGVTPGAENMPVIMVSNRPLRDITNEAGEALVKANCPPQIYVRSAMLTIVRRDEKGHPVILPMNESHVRGRMARVANFKKKYKDGTITDVHPPVDVVRDFMALQEWEVPTLEAVVAAPTLRPDGSIISVPGYDPATNLYYMPAPDLEMPPVKEEPTKEEVAGAVALIEEVLVDFPFVGEASYANTVGLMLTPIMRPAINGSVPLALIDAPRAGSGKGLLSNVISHIAAGRDAGMMSAPSDEDEWRKRITSFLKNGTTLVTIDNIRRPLDSDALTSVLTATFWEDRVLGVSDMVRLPQRATWMATGNNIQLGGDMPRRCYWIRLDSQEARPWQRPTDRFKHPELLDWVHEKRGELLAALLTIARAWYASGCPQTAMPTIGSFETWARTVGNILAHAGIQGFLGNLETLYDLTDEDANQWEAFLIAWHRAFEEQPVTMKDLCDALSSGSGSDEGLASQRHPDMLEALPDSLSSAMEHDKKGTSGRSFRVKLGKALSKKADVRFGNMRLERAGEDTHVKVNFWRVRDMRDSGS